jgi:FkbM family methyltransferase
MKYVLLAGRWPLPDIPVALYSETGACVLQDNVCEDPDRWFSNEDVHVRDIISSCLMKCAFRPGCRSADIGGNVGLMTYTMLALGSQVVTVEPQHDLCNVIKRTAALNGWDSRSQVICGGVDVHPVQQSLSLDMKHVFRIGGSTRSGTIEVPVQDIMQILPSGHYDFIKIDTDSIDCPLLGKLVAEIFQGHWSVDSMILETWEGNCKGGVLAELVHRLQQLNYTVYRTLLWERQFDSTGGLPTVLATDQLPDYATEVFEMRFAR